LIALLFRVVQPIAALAAMQGQRSVSFGVKDDQQWVFALLQIPRSFDTAVVNVVMVQQLGD